VEQDGPATQVEINEWQAVEERNCANMNAIVLHAKSDADGILHLEVDHPNAEYEVVVRQKAANGDAIAHISEVRYVHPAQLFLRFADGFEGTWMFDRPEFDISKMNVAAVTVSSDGTYIEVQSKSGEDVQMDSLSLRYLVDEKYAAKIDQSIRELHMGPAEAAEAARLSMLMRDPRWADVGDEDDLFE
jgi:hypothetical protein